MNSLLPDKGLAIQTSLFRIGLFVMHASTVATDKGLAMSTYSLKQRSVQPRTCARIGVGGLHGNQFAKNSPTKIS